MDNDLAVTDCCPGFGSAAKSAAVSVREAALDVAAMAETSTKVSVYEAMGRHAGWLAAAGGLDGKEPGHAPPLIIDRKSDVSGKRESVIFAFGGVRILKQTTPKSYSVLANVDS